MQAAGDPVVYIGSCSTTPVPSCGLEPVSSLGCLKMGSWNQIEKEHTALVIDTTIHGKRQAPMGPSLAMLVTKPLLLLTSVTWGGRRSTRHVQL